MADLIFQLQRLYGFNPPGSRFGFESVEYTVNTQLIQVNVNLRDGGNNALNCSKEGNNLAILHFTAAVGTISEISHFFDDAERPPGLGSTLDVRKEVYDGGAKWRVILEARDFLPVGTTFIRFQISGSHPLDPSAGVDPTPWSVQGGVVQIETA